MEDRKKYHSMKYPSVLILLILVIFGCSTGKKDQHPNILFIAIDDLKPMLGCYGDTIIQSPNIDLLAEQGVVFLNNHCQQALCGPTRASLLTGLYPDQIRVWGFDRKIRDAGFEVLTLPQHFKNNGYYTVGISKIFDPRCVDKYRDSLSWSEPAFPLSEEAMHPYYPKETGPVSGYFYHSDQVQNVLDSLLNINPSIADSPEPSLIKLIKPATECLDLPDDAYKDGVFATKAIEYLDKLAKSDQAFFLAVGFERPHLPYTAPKKYWDMYQRNDIKPSSYQQWADNDVDFAYTSSGSIKSYTDEEGNFIYKRLDRGEKLTREEQKKLIHGYMAAVSYIDVQVGKILQHLKDLQLEKNTIVVIWGDHGYHLYDHNMWGKSTNFEQGTRSPLIIKGPTVAPSKTNFPTGFIDLFPTLCDMANIPVPVHLSGKSMLSLMEGNNSQLPSHAISQFQRGDTMGYAIRDERYRYVEWIAQGRHVNPEADLTHSIAKQLFDYRTDPLETKNLADNPDYLEIQNNLHLRLSEFYNRQIINWERPGIHMENKTK